jgi:hypothetical protein
VTVLFHFYFFAVPAFMALDDERARLEQLERLEAKIKMLRSKL